MRLCGTVQEADGYVWKTAVFSSSVEWSIVRHGVFTLQLTKQWRSYELCMILGCIEE
jgi:hypothetical protein